MDLTIAPTFAKRSAPGLRRFRGMLAAIFGIVWLSVLAVGPVHAEPVQINRVVRTLTGLQGSTDLQLTLISQDPVTTGTTGSVPAGGPQSGGTSGIATTDPKLDALLAGFPIVTSNVEIGIDDVSEEGEVDGTICDCGEILIAGGGFPKWPLLFLTAVPLAFIPHCDDCEQQTGPTPTPPSTPQPTPTPTPEPASLLIFGTGLVAFGAAARRRYNQAKLARQNQKTEEEHAL